MTRLYKGMWLHVSIFILLIGIQRELKTSDAHKRQNPSLDGFPSFSKPRTLRDVWLTVNVLLAARRVDAKDLTVVDLASEQTIVPVQV